MTSIDQRIVQMVFDNSKFESAVKTTMQTLDNLSSKLNLGKAAKGFNELDKASKSVTFSDLSQNVDKVANRFSVLGIVGMTAIQNITNSAMQAGKSLLSSFTSPLIQGGITRALNLEQAKFQIEGLGHTWDSVKGDIDYGVKDTAYGLDAAARAAGQLLASNVQVGDSMKTALRGISGVAAMTNSEYEDISRIFTTVAGNGRLMGDQLLQLSGRGINAAATLGKYLGKSEAEIREMVSKGQIDFATFAAAMDSAFGEHAKEANKTFTGALSNMKAALSRIGAEFATPYFENIRHVIVALIPVLNDLKASLTDTFKIASDGMKAVADYLVSVLGKADLKNRLAEPIAVANRILVAFAKTLANLFKAIISYVKPIVNAFNSVFGVSLLELVARAAEAMERFTSMLIVGDEMGNNIQKTFSAVFLILSKVIDILSAIVGLVASALLTAFIKTFGFLADILFRIGGFLSDVIFRIKEFVDAVLALDTVQFLMNMILTIFNNLKTALLTVTSAIHKFTDAILDGVFDILLNLFDKIASAATFALKGINALIVAVADLIKKFMELPAVRNAIEKLNNVFNLLRNNFGEVASILKDRLISGFQKAKEVVSNFISAVRELISQYIELPTAQEAVARVQEFLINLFESGVDIFQKTGEVVSKIVERVKELSSTSLEGIIQNFIKLRDKIVEVINVSGKIQTLKDVFAVMKRGFSSLVRDSGNAISRVKSTLSEFATWARTKFASIDLGDLLAAGAGASMIAFFISMTRVANSAKKAIDTLGGVAGSFKKISDSIGGTLKSFSGYLKDKGTAAKIESVSSIIKSVVALAGAVALLATMDQASVEHSAKVLGALGVALIAMSGVMNALIKSVSPEVVAAASAQVLAISGALLGMVLSLKILTTVDTDGIAERLVALGVLLGELVAAVIVMSKFSSKLEVSSIAILSMSVSLLLMAKALSSIGNIDTGSLGKCVAVLGMLTGLFAALSVTSRIVNPAAMASFIAASLSLLVLVKVLNKLGEMDSAVAVKGIMGLMVLVPMIMLLFKSLEKTSAYAARAGAAILMISVAMNLFAIAIKKMSEIEMSDLAKSAAVVSEMMVVFSLVVAVTRYAGQHAHKAGAAILAMSAAMLLLTGSIAIMSKLDPAGLARATIAINSIMAMFALIVAATSLAKNASQTIKYMAIAIAALAAVVAMLSLIEPRNLATAAAAIDSLMICFSFLVIASAEAKKAYGAMGFMVAVVAGLALILKAIAEIDPARSLSAARSLSEILLALSISTALMSFLNPTALQGVLIGIAAFAAIIAGLGTLMVAIGALVTYVPEIKQFLNEAIPVLESIGQAIGSFIGGIVAGFTSSASKALVSLGVNLSLFMSNIQGFLQGAKAIGDDQGIQNGINNIVGMVLTLTAADFIDALTWFSSSGSAIKGLAENLPLLGNAMSDFCKALNDGDVNLEVMERGSQAAKALAEMAASLPRSGGLFELFAGRTMNMKDFGAGLKDFGTSLKEYGDSVNGVNVSAIQSSIGPARSLAELAEAIPRTGGLIDFLAGSSNMEDFGKNLVAFGRSLIGYSQTIGNINADNIEKSIAPASSLIELAKTIQASGGVVSFFAGSNTMGDFGKNIEAFGKSLVNFSNTISSEGSIDANKIKEVVEAAQLIVDLANSLQAKMGGLSGMLDGDNSLGALGEQLKKFGTGLVEFSDAISGEDGNLAVNTQNILATKEAAIAIIQMANEINSASGGNANAVMAGLGIFASFGQNGNLGSISKGLAEFGKAMVDYSREVSAGIDVGAIYTSVEGAKAIRQLMDYMPNIIDSFNAITGIGALLMFPMYATMIGSGLKAFSDELEGVNVESVSKGAEAARYLQQTISHLPGILETISTIAGTYTFVYGCQKLGEGISEFAKSMDGVDADKARTAAEVLNTLNSVMKDMGDLGNMAAAGDNLENFGRKFTVFAATLSEANVGENVDKMVETVNKLKDSVMEFVQIDLSSLESVIFQFRTFATDTAEGFANSFTEATPNAQDQARAMVQSALDAASETLSSGQTMFMEAGTSLIDGFAGSIVSNAFKVTDAVNSMLAGIISSFDYGQFVQCGTEIVNSLASGVSGNSSAVVNAVTVVVNESINVTNSLIPQFTKSGERAMIFLVNGIKSQAASVKSAVNGVVRGSAQGIDYGPFRSIGENMSKGLASGIRSKKGEVVAAAREVASAAASEMRKATEVRSPSRVTMRIGGYITQGLAIGMVKMKSRVEDSAGEVANAAIDRTSKILSAIDDAIQNDMEFAPVVTPVLDSAQFDKDLKEFASDGFGLNANSYGFNSALGQLTKQMYASKFGVNNQPQEVSNVTNVYVNDAIVNDDVQMRAVTKDFLVELARKGAM